MKNKHIVLIVGGLVFLLFLPKILNYLTSLGLDNIVVRAIVAALDYLMGAFIAIGILAAFVWFAILLIDGKIKF
mgnify:CR=1 FL=1